MKATKPTLSEAYLEYQQRLMCGPGDWRRTQLSHMLRAILANYREREHVPLLTKPECVAQAKKLLGRALQREFTRKQIEEFLGV